MISEQLRLRLLVALGTGLLRLLAATWRVRFANPEVVNALRDRKQNFVHILWHGQLLPLIWVHRRRGITIMVSEHRDGELIARVAESIGFRTVRGSTTRGAARALLGGAREVESGWDLAVTVDGPRGPAGTVAPGALVIAQRTGAPMIPTAAAASRAWRLRSWDRFMIPKPFAKVIVTYGDPVQAASGSARAATTDIETDRVRSAIDDASRRAMEQLSVVA